jgi:uncharacterized protein (DUF488 family)
MRTRLYTIGHSRHSSEHLLQLLAAWRVRRLVDVRRIPFSRRNPQFNRERLAGDLRHHGIAYWHLEDLGGRRDPPAEGASENTAWRNPFLRSYADYAQTKPFGDALDALCLAAAKESCAIMCAESDWRQCHRQIIADYLLARDVEVLHILADGPTEPARLTPSAAVAEDGTVRYTQPGQQQLRLI